MELTIREATADDLPAIVAMLADDPLGQTREDTSLPLDPRYTAAFEQVDASPHQHQLVACHDGQVVGCLHLTLIPGVARLGTWRAQIEAVRVAGSARGAGLGEQLIRHAIDRARAAGCRLVQLTSDKARADAHRFYERLGFVASHVGYKLSL